MHLFLRYRLVYLMMRSRKDSQGVIYGGIAGSSKSHNSRLLSAPTCRRIQRKNLDRRSKYERLKITCLRIGFQQVSDASSLNRRRVCAGSAGRTEAGIHSDPHSPRVKLLPRSLVPPMQANRGGVEAVCPISHPTLIHKVQSLKSSVSLCSSHQRLMAQVQVLLRLQ